MIAGMIAMALAIGRGSEEAAPPGRAVIGELLFATVATLLVLPTIFSVVQPHAYVKSLTLDPDDPDFLASVPEASQRNCIANCWHLPRL